MYLGRRPHTLMNPKPCWPRMHVIVDPHIYAAGFAGNLRREKKIFESYIMLWRVVTTKSIVRFCRQVQPTGQLGPQRQNGL